MRFLHAAFLLASASLNVPTCGDGPVDAGQPDSGAAPIDCTPVGTPAACPAGCQVYMASGIPGAPACFHLDSATWTAAPQAVGCAPVVVDVWLLWERCFVDRSGNVSAEREEPGGLVLFAGVSTCSIPTCP